MTEDPDRQRVYAAQNQVCHLMDWSPLDAPPKVTIHGSTITLQPDRKFGDLASVQRYVDAVLQLNWVQQRWSPGPVRVRERRGQTKAHYLLGEIAVPTQWRWALREMVVLHELTHHLAPPEEHHGAIFQETLTALLRELVSYEAAFLFEVGIRASG
jgi:putative metallohydrolase (TIGR04338 family)